MRRLQGEFKTLMRNKVFQEEKADGKKYLAGIAKNGEKLLFELPSKECREQTKVILKHLGIRCWEC